MDPLDLADRSWPVMRRLMDVHTFIYRASDGHLGHRLPGIRAPMLLLDHVGAKSGTRRTSPLIYIPDGDDAVIVASKGGHLTAHPDTIVQIGDERRAVHARVATPDERERLWPKAVELYPGYGEYQERSKGREIPLVILEPR